MTARELIASDVPSLSIDQTGRDAFHLLSDHHVKHLPVVDDRQFLGLLSEEEIFNHKLYAPLREYDFSLLRRLAVRPEEHVFEVMRIMGENRLTVLPVVDAAGQYLGLIPQNELLRSFSQAASFAEPGGIIVLGMGRRDYSLANLARLVENEDAKILGAFVTSTADSDYVEVTLKFDRLELGRILASLERHDYEIKESYAESEMADNLQERYDSLMSYLNV